MVPIVQRRAGTAWIQQRYNFAMAENDPPRGIRRRRASLFPDIPDAPIFPPAYAVPLHLLRATMAVCDDIDSPGPDQRRTRHLVCRGAGRGADERPGAGGGAALVAGPALGDARAWRYAAQLGRLRRCRMAPAGARPPASQPGWMSPPAGRE